MTTDGDVKSFDIRFKPCGREGNYCKEIVVAPATSILLTRESGLKPLTKYDFEIRAKSPRKVDQTLILVSATLLTQNILVSAMLLIGTTLAIQKVKDSVYIYKYGMRL